MNCTTRTPLRATLALCVLGLAATVRAQDAGPPALDGLLRQLAATPATAWDARIASMRAAGAAARDAAKTRREGAAAKTAEAATHVKRADALDAEVDKLDKLRAALAAVTFRDPAGTGETAATDAGKLETTLAQLVKLPAAGWDERLAKLKEAAGAARTAATAATAAATGLGKAAEQDDAAAAALDAQIERVAGLRELLGKLQLDVLASTTPVKATAGTPEPAKPEAAKPEAAKPEPAKSEPAMPAPKAQSEPTPMAAPQIEEHLVTYDDDVFPIFEQNCTTCHDPGDASGGLDLTTHGAVLAGGGSGRTIRPGNPDASRLYLLVSHKEKPTMPPDEPRIDKEPIETIRLWIAQGAPKDRAQAQALAVERAAARAKAAADAAAKAVAKANAPVVLPSDAPKLAKAMPPRAPAMRAVAVSPGAPLVAVPGFNQVLLLAADDLRELAVFEFDLGAVERLVFSLDGARLLAAGGAPGRQGGAVLYDVRTGAEVGRYGLQPDVVFAADLSPDGALVALGGTRRKVEVFRVDGTKAWDAAHDDWVTALAFDPDGQLLASADRGGNVFVREAPNGREVHTLGGHDGIVAALAFAPDGGLLATACQDRTVRAFKMTDGNQAWSQRVHDADVLTLTWGPAGRLLSGGADGRVVLWKPDGGREPDLPRRDEWVYGVAASADGARAFATDWLGRLAVYDLKARKVVGEVAPLRVAQDG